MTIRGKETSKALILCAGILMITMISMTSISLAKERVEIVYWQPWTNTEERTRLFEDYIKRFEAKYDWIKIKSVFVSPGEERTKAPVALAGGVAPDVLTVETDFLASLARDGSLVPLEDLVKDQKVDLSEFFPADINNGKYAGHLYGLPQTTAAGNSFLMYNRARFSEAGLPYSTPKTWKQLLEYARKLYRTDGQSVTVLPIANLNEIWWLSLLYSNNGSLLSDDGRRVTFNSKEALQMCDFLALLLSAQGGYQAYTDVYAKNPYGQLLGAHLGPFVDGRAAMTHAAQPTLKDLKTLSGKIDIDYGVGPIPYNSENPAATSRAPAGRAWYLVIPKGGTKEKQLAAFLWIKWLTYDMEGGATFMMTMGRPAPLRRVNSLKGYFETNKEWRRMVEEIFPTTVPITITPVHQKIIDAWRNVCDDVMAQRRSAAASLQENARIAQQVLDGFWKK